MKIAVMKVSHLMVTVVGPELLFLIYNVVFRHKVVRTQAYGLHVYINCLHFETNDVMFRKNVFIHHQPAKPLADIAVTFKLNIDGMFVITIEMVRT